MLKTDQKQFHLPIAPGEVGKYCILPGDPDRCERIAAHLQNPVHLGQKREYNLWNGTLCGELVTVYYRRDTAEDKFCKIRYVVWKFEQ